MKNRFIPLLALAALFGTVSFLHGCDDSDNAGNNPDTGAPVEQPGATPSVSPSPNPSPSPSQAMGNWTQIFEQRDCPFPLCPSRTGFAVQWDGTYIVGPAENPDRTGMITPQELDQLTTLANAMAAENLDVEPTCQQLQPVPGRASLLLSLTRGDNRSFTIHEINNQAQLECFRGNPTLAQELTRYLDNLASIYGIATGTPTPSPSPSVAVQTPLPSPSVTP